MAGAAVAPALGTIKEHFSESSSMMIQLIISLPALFIIITNLAFPLICRLLKTKAIALIGLAFYIVSGTFAFCANSIEILLIFRAVLGMSVGLLMPLATGLLAFYYPPEEQSALMGKAAAMNQLGGVAATLLAGLLSTISWRLSFLVYLFGFISIILVIRHLPNERLPHHDSRFSVKSLFKFHPSVIGMFLVMMIFFIFPANYAIVSKRQGQNSDTCITLIMVAYDVVAFGAGLLFGKIMKIGKRSTKYISPVLFFISYWFLSMNSALGTTIAALFLGGLANGVGVPYINTIASIKGGKEAITTVMPLVSAGLYLGQFFSPIVVRFFSRGCFPGDISAPYKTAMILSVVLFIQVFLTRKHHGSPSMG